MCSCAFFAITADVDLQYEQMLEDMVDEGAGSQKVALDQDKIASVLNGDRNFSVACELGVRYPTLRAMLNRGT